MPNLKSAFDLYTFCTEKYVTIVNGLRIYFIRCVYISAYTA